MLMLNRTILSASLGLVAIGAVATPSFAQGDGEVHMTAARAKALRECSALEQRFSESTWGTREIFVYRSCMAEHGQAE